MRLAVLRLTFCTMVTGMYDYDHIFLGWSVVEWQWACMSATGCPQTVLLPNGNGLYMCSRLFLG